MTTRAILIQLQPIFNASLAKKLVAVIALLCLPTDFEANLAENESREFLTDLKTSAA